MKKIFPRPIRAGVLALVFMCMGAGVLAVSAPVQASDAPDNDSDWNSSKKKDDDKKRKEEDKKREEEQKKDEEKRKDEEKKRKKEKEKEKEREKDKDKDKRNNNEQSSDTPTDKNAVVVYYTPGDKNWPAAEKIIDEVNKKYPKLKITKVPNDTPTGRMSLKQIEDVYKIKDHGDITATFEAFVLVSKGDQRMVEESFEAVCERVLGEAKLKGKLSVDIASYVKEVFGPTATTVTCAQALDATDYYLIQVDKKDVGWVANGFHHITCPICIDTQFLVALKSPGLTVVDMRPVRWLERRGVRLEKPEVEKFFKQFNGRTPQESAKPVDGISGATTTTTAYVNTINEIMQEIIKREKP